MKTITVWVSKYALTQGIFSAKAEDCGDGMICIKGEPGYSCDAYYHGSEWHLSKRNAVAKAKAMQRKKIASLQKALDSVKKLEFK